MKIGALIVAILVLVGCLIFFWNDDLSKHQEIGSKREWSVLQATELEYRNKAMPDRLVIVTNEEYRIAGLAPSNLQKRVWVLLNPKFEPFIKQLPAGEITVFQIDLERLSTNTARPEVLQELRKWVSSDPERGRSDN